jgi:hypothetical protein
MAVHLYPATDVNAIGVIEQLEDADATSVEVRVIHYRFYGKSTALYANQLPESKGGYTIAYTIDSVYHKSCSITFAIAACSAEDNFVKATGTQLATKRLLEDGPLYETDLSVGSDAIVIMVDYDAETGKPKNAWYEFSNSSLLRRSIAEHCIEVAEYMRNTGSLLAMEPDDDGEEYDEEDGVADESSEEVVADEETVK